MLPAESLMLNWNLFAFPDVFVYLTYNVLKYGILTVPVALVQAPESTLYS